MSSVLKSWMRMPWERTASIQRYSTLPTIHKETVAEHIFFVSLWSYAIALDLEERGFKVEMGVVLEKALVHDLDEALSGDFIRTFKYGSEEVRSAIEKETDRLMSALPGLPPGVYGAWREAKDWSLEGQIVSVADLFSVVAYACRELRLGNAFAKELLGRAPGFFERVTGNPSFDQSLSKYVDEAVSIARDVTRGGQNVNL